MRPQPPDAAAPAMPHGHHRAPAAPSLMLLALGLSCAIARSVAAGPSLPLCAAPEESVFACPLRGGGGLQLCAPAAGSGGAGGMPVVLRELAPDGSVQWSFGADRLAGDAYKANFLTNGALTLAHLRFEDRGVEYVLVVGEDQTEGLAGLARATGPGTYEWRLCEEDWKSRLDYRFYGEARIPADPVAAPLP